MLRNPAFFKNIAPLLFLTVILFPSKVFAVSLSVSGMPSSINFDQEVEVNLELICNCGDSYFRGVFYSSGTNYFGYTKDNSGTWVGNESDKTKYFKVAGDEIKEGSWSGKLKVKPDVGDSSYIGPGNYFFKVGR